MFITVVHDKFMFVYHPKQKDTALKVKRKLFTLHRRETLPSARHNSSRQNLDQQAFLHVKTSERGRLLRGLTREAPGPGAS